MVTIERATSADVSDILAIANWAADHLVANFATTHESLDEWTQSYATTHERYPWLVAREAGEVIGFAKASPHRARGAYAWTAEVSVYIHRDHHRRGIGRDLYERLIPLLRAQGYVTLLAGIALPNPASVRLHESVGFEQCSTFRRVGWKFEQWHDVGYWELHLTDGAPRPTRSVSDVWLEVWGAR